MVEKSVQLQSSLNNQLKINPISYYKNYKIAPQGQNSVTISTTTQQKVFEIPAHNVINFSRMSITFKLNAVASLADLIKYIRCDYCPWFTQLELLTSQGLYLVNVKNLDKYSKLTAAFNLNCDKRGEVDGFMHVSDREMVNLASSNTEADPPVINESPFIIMYGSLTDAGATCDIGFMFKTDCFLNATANVKASMNDYAVIRSGDLIITGAAAGENNIEDLTYTIKLKDLLPDTIFNVDKDIYISDPLTLRITFNTRGKITQQMDENGANGAEGSVDLSLQNLSLNHYIQGNRDIVAALVEEGNYQKELIYPELQESSQNFGSGTLQGTSVRIISDSPNSRLYKSYAGMFLGDATNKINNSQNHGLITIDGGSRANPIKYTAVEISLNSNIITNLNVIENEDYDHGTNLFANHSFKSIASFKETGCIPMLYNPGKSYPEEYNNNELKGQDFGGSKDLILNHKFTTTSADHTHYIYTVILKTLYLKRGILGIVPFDR